MKKLLILLVPLITLMGCTNEQEEEKNLYLNYKNTLQNKIDFSNDVDLVCDITFSVDRITEEEISYRAIIDNPKEDMYEIKAILLHNYFTEDIFPSIGIFDDSYDLIMDNEEVKGISLIGYINTEKEIEDLDLELRLLIEYKDKEQNIKTIYYKST